MNTIHRFARALPLAAVCALATKLACAADIRVYEWHEPNGVTSFSQSRPPASVGNVTSREVAVPSLTPAQRVAVRAYLSSLDERQAADADRFLKSVAQADAVIRDATRDLSDRERYLEAGRTPRPGDRVGNANGSSRLRLEYFVRQRELERAVQVARARVAEAYNARDALVE